MKFDSMDSQLEKHFKSILEKTTKDVEWEEYQTDGGTKAYPFWKTCVAGINDTYEDFLEWFHGKNVKTDLTGVVKPPKAEFDLDNTHKPVVSKLDVNVDMNKDLSVVPKVEEPKDLTGVVKPKSEIKPQKIEEIPVSKLKKGELKDLTGVVKPKSDIEPQKLDVPSETKLKKAEPDMGDNSGVVEPKSEFGGNAEPKVDFDFSEPSEPVIVSEWGETLLDKYKKLGMDD